MYERLLNYLVCPACGSALALTAVGEEGPGDGEIDSGLLRCDSGEHTYPVVGGIPRLLPDAMQTFAGDVARLSAARAVPATALTGAGGGDRRTAGRDYDRRTSESFSHEWEHHELGDRTWGWELDERVDTYFLQGTGIPKDELDGMLMLDAGCGNGSQSVAYTAFGLEVIAIDLSRGLEHGQAFRHLYPGAQPDRVHFVQADLQHPPLPPASVDIIHSAGVLHHTPSTERTFRRLAPLVRDGGTFYVWVYKHERLVTPTVNTIRAVTTRLSTRQFALLARITADPFRLFCKLADRLGLRSYPPVSRREAALALTDIFGAPYAHYHSFGEVEGWLRSEGFGDTRLVNETRRGLGACGRRAGLRAEAA